MESKAFVIAVIVLFLLMLCQPQLFQLGTPTASSGTAAAPANVPTVKITITNNSGKPKILIVNGAQRTVPPGVYIQEGVPLDACVVYDGKPVSLTPPPN